MPSACVDAGGGAPTTTTIFPSASKSSATLMPRPVTEPHTAGEFDNVYPFIEEEAAAVSPRSGLVKSNADGPAAAGMG